MSIHYEDDQVRLFHGDCLDVLRTLPDASVDAVVTDPPYNLSFMAREWDSHVSAVAFQQWCELWTAECLRVLKPGGHLLAFGGTRTWHRLACAVEDAGFEVRDSIAWMYGSGFPKSLDVSKAIDKAAGAELDWREEPRRGGGGSTAHVNQLGGRKAGVKMVADPATPDAERWQGWGTALKPAFEPVVVARKPLTGTVAANVLEHGTGALNIDGCRVNPGEAVAGGGGWAAHRVESTDGWNRPYTNGVGKTEAHTAGRWPTNVLLDDSQAEVLDEQSGETASRADRVSAERVQVESSSYGIGQGRRDLSNSYTDSGGASRFFPTFRYEAKAPKSERPKVNGTAHPTVKPLTLMSWLVRLVTPPGGTVLEPFAGSGTTVEACVIEGFKCVAIEKTDEYLPLITQRINRQRNPVAYMQAAGDDLGLFDLEEDTA